MIEDQNRASLSIKLKAQSPNSSEMFETICMHAICNPISRITHWILINFVFTCIWFLFNVFVVKEPHYKRSKSTYRRFSQNESSFKTDGFYLHSNRRNKNCIHQLRHVFSRTIANAIVICSANWTDLHFRWDAMSSFNPRPGDVLLSLEHFSFWLIETTAFSSLKALEKVRKKNQRFNELKLIQWTRQVCNVHISLRILMIINPVHFWV